MIVSMVPCSGQYKGLNSLVLRITSYLCLIKVIVEDLIILSTALIAELGMEVNLYVLAKSEKPVKTLYSGSSLPL